MKKLTIFCLSVLFLSSCEKDQDLDDILSLSIKSEHFTYHMTEDDTVGVDVIWQEKYLSWLCEELDIKTDIHIDYYKYPNRHVLTDMTGRSVNAFAQSNASRLHTIWQVDNHECVHILANRSWGIPPAIFDEGLAVAHQANYSYEDFIPAWNGNDFHAICRDNFLDGKIPALEDVIETSSFWKHDSAIVYPLSGSFISYLLDHYSLGPVEAIFRSCGFKDGSSTIKRKFRKASGIELESAWQEWLNYLNNY